MLIESATEQIKRKWETGTIIGPDIYNNDLGSINDWMYHFIDDPARISLTHK